MRIRSHELETVDAKVAVLIITDGDKTPKAAALLAILLVIVELPTVNPTLLIPAPVLPALPITLASSNLACAFLGLGHFVGALFSTCPAPTILDDVSLSPAKITRLVCVIVAQCWTSSRTTFAQW